MKASSNVTTQAAVYQGTGHVTVIITVATGRMKTAVSHILLRLVCHYRALEFGTNVEREMPLLAACLRRSAVYAYAPIGSRKGGY